MPKFTDLLLDPETGDLQILTDRGPSGAIEQGIAIGEVTWQNQALILQLSKGEMKEYPFLGASVAELLSDHEILGWKREVTLQLQSDGMRVYEIDIATINHKLIVAAAYS
ncbi:MAG: hypothetical protein LUF04_07180 [Bacteroides sp.]|nr:hypothetical protein [Bacteroides sp.]